MDSGWRKTSTILDYVRAASHLMKTQVQKVTNISFLGAGGRKYMETVLFSLPHCKRFKREKVKIPNKKKEGGSMREGEGKTF